MLSDITLVFGIGAQKAGTTWLYDALARHPECHVPPKKEVHYFDVQLMEGERSHFELFAAHAIKTAQALPGTRGEALAAVLSVLREQIDYLEIYAAEEGDHSRYLSWLTRGHAEQRIVADITPAYALLSRQIFAQLFELSSDTRFVFILRDPVDRLWSAIRMMADVGKGSDSAFRTRARKYIEDLEIGRLTRHIDRSDYQATMTELEAVAPKESILYLFYEELFSDAGVERLAAFLGIGPINGDFTELSNPGRTLTLAEEDAERLYLLVASVYESMATRFGDSLPARWRARMDAYGDISRR